MNDQDLIRRCTTEIELKLNWGNSLDWNNQDFELLEEEIAEATGTRLSVTKIIAKELRSYSLLNLQQNLQKNDGRFRNRRHFWHWYYY